MKFCTKRSFVRFGSLLSIVGLFVAVNACRTVEPESPEIEDEESFEEPVSSSDSGQESTEWEPLDEQDGQGSASLDSPENTSSESTPVKTTYTVQPGDNLWKISKSQYGRGIYWRAIRDHNGLSESGDINAGQSLEIPELTEQRKDELKSLAADQGNGGSSTTGTSVSDPGMYVTKEGDTFWKIAKREYGNPEQWKRIWRANKSKVPDPDKLKAGTKIRIPGRGSGSSGKGSEPVNKGAEKGSN